MVDLTIQFALHAVMIKQRTRLVVSRPGTTRTQYFAVYRAAGEACTAQDESPGDVKERLRGLGFDQETCSEAMGNSTSKNVVCNGTKVCLRSCGVCHNTTIATTSDACTGTMKVRLVFVLQVTVYCDYQLCTSAPDHVPRPLPL